MRNRELLRAIEIELLLDDAEGPFGFLTLDRPVEHIIGDILDGIREHARREHLLHSLHAVLHVSPEKSLLERFLFRERKIFLCEGFIVAKGSVPAREEFSP